MKTMKLIDLFIKIANGEDTPKKIDFNGNIYSHNGNDDNSYYYCKENDKLLEDAFIFEELNDEVEIIEDTPKEDKKIKKLDKQYATDMIFTYDKSGSNLYSLSLYVNSDIVNKLNEIIDKINEE